MKTTKLILKLALIAAALALAIFGRLPEPEENLAFVLAGFGFGLVLKR